MIYEVCLQKGTNKSLLREIIRNEHIVISPRWACFIHLNAEEWHQVYIEDGSLEIRLEKIRIISQAYPMVKKYFLDAMVILKITLEQNINSQESVWLG